MKIIECKQLSKSFGDKLVLDKVDLAVEQGQFFGLVGMNGSGKSTMIKAMLDLVSINNGEITLDGKPYRRVNARKNVTYFPDRFNPPQHLTGNDFIRYMLELHGTSYTPDDLNNVLNSLELDNNAMKQSVGQLSKGMTQKLGLASCLLSSKSIMIFDEPMSGLDPRARVLFKKQLEKLRNKGVTLFFSSHVLTDVEELADNMAVLHKSKILFTGSPSEFKAAYKASDMEQAYISCIEQLN